MKNKVRKGIAVALAIVSGVAIPDSFHMFTMDMNMGSQWAFFDISMFAMAFIGFGEAYWIYTKEDK